MAKSNDISGMQAQQSKPNLLATGEFTEAHSVALQVLILNLGHGQVTASTSWLDGSEIATVEMQLKSSCGKPITVRIRGEYRTLRERIFEHLQSQESRLVTELETNSGEIQ